MFLDTVFLVIEQGESSLEVTAFASEEDAQDYVDALRGTHDPEDLDEDEDSYFVYHGKYVGVREVTVAEGAAAKKLIESVKE